MDEINSAYQKPSAIVRQTYLIVKNMFEIFHLLKRNHTCNVSVGADLPNDYSR